MSREVDKKKKKLDFFKGFLITYGVLIILTIISSIIRDNISYYTHSSSYLNDKKSVEYIYFSSLGALGIIISLIGAITRKKNPYFSMGLIAAIFGPVFLIIKTDREQIVEPYTEQPEKEKVHFKNGVWLSIGLLILYLPLFYFGFMTQNVPVVLVTVIVIALNIFIGVMILFYIEKLRYISKGMIVAILVIAILIPPALIVIMIIINLI